MNYVLFLYLLLFPFGQLLSLQATPSVRVPLVDFVALAFALYWLGDFLWKACTGRSEKLPVFTRPLLTFGAYAAFTLVLGTVSVGYSAFISGLLYLLRLFIYILFYLGVAGLVKKTKKVLTVLDFLVAVGSFIAIGGLVGYWLYPDTRALSEYGWDNHYYRLIGSFLDPTFNGILLVLFLVLVLVSRSSGINQKALKLFLFSTGWVALVLTYSRASYLAAMAAFVVLVFLRRSGPMLVGGVALFLATFFLLPHPHSSAGTNLARTQTISSRFANYNQALSVGLKNPVFGVGYNLYSRAVNGPDSQDKIAHSGSGVHSSLLFVFATMGIGGLLIYLGLGWKIIVSAIRERKSSIGTITLCSAAALLVHSLFDNSLFYPWVMGWMAILLAGQEER